MRKAKITNVSLWEAERALFDTMNRREGRIGRNHTGSGRSALFRAALVAYAQQHHPDLVEQYRKAVGNDYVRLAEVGLLGRGNGE